MAAKLKLYIVAVEWGGTKIYEDISEDELEEEIVTAVSEDHEDSYKHLSDHSTGLREPSRNS